MYKYEKTQGLQRIVLFFCQCENTQFLNVKILIFLPESALDFHSIFLNDEFDYIEKSSVQFQYTKFFLLCAKILALKIHKCKCFPKIQNNNFSNNNL